MVHSNSDNLIVSPPSSPCQCITDWKSVSPSCPICRKELDDDANDQDDDWILTSHNIVQLKSQYEKVLNTPYDFVSERPVFPPADNKRGIKSAGDAFSLAVGEVLDVITPLKRRNAPAQSQLPAKPQPQSQSQSHPQSESESSVQSAASPQADLPVAEAVVPASPAAPLPVAQPIQ